MLSHHKNLSDFSVIGRLECLLGKIEFSILKGMVGVEGKGMLFL